MTIKTQAEHKAVNANEFPGTRQLCVRCNQPTDRCEEDSIYLDMAFEDQGDLDPLCEGCAEECAS